MVSLWMRLPDVAVTVTV
jgi:hypothetical protein